MKGKNVDNIPNIVLLLGGAAGVLTAIATWIDKWRSSHSTARRDAIDGYAKLSDALSARVNILVTQIERNDTRISALEAALLQAQQELMATRIERDEARQRVVALERRVSELEAELAKFKKDC